MIYVGLTNNFNEITIIATIFSTISIISSIFDCISSSLLIKCETITLVEIDVELQQLANTQHRKFHRIIINQWKPISRELAKVISVDWKLIEILTPIQTNTGAQLVLYIRNNDSNENLGSNIVSEIREVVDSGELTQVMLYVHVYTVPYTESVGMRLFTHPVHFWNWQTWTRIPRILAWWRVSIKKSWKFERDKQWWELVNTIKSTDYSFALVSYKNIRTQKILIHRHFLRFGNVMDYVNQQNSN